MKPTEVFHRIVPCVAHLYCWKAMSHEPWATRWFTRSWKMFQTYKWV